MTTAPRSATTYEPTSTSCGRFTLAVAEAILFSLTCIFLLLSPGDGTTKTSKQFTAETQRAQRGHNMVLLRALCVSAVLFHLDMLGVLAVPSYQPWEPAPGAGGC